MAVHITETGQRVIGQTDPTTPSKRHSDPDFDPRTGEWKTDETAAEQAKAHRQEYPAEFFNLPGKRPQKADPYDWRTNLVQRTWLATSDRQATDLEDLRAHRDECWLWCGAHQSDGRAVVRISGKVRSLKRVMWTLFRQAPDTRKLVVRTCETVAEECHNPWHHKLMTKSDATKHQRARQARQGK
ncbi:hypothetical protein SUDANB15_02610 [Streptomyces sp. enrichment culture]|uniref:hypothetical protein n=1 Tax=Streptomyces sp. enrichment culture TaxID=1795815 RepID=UPI003F55CDA4